MARGAIESLSENFADGVVAPAFWYVILGLPGLFAYKAINTMDSIIGYKSEQYRDFGMAAARLDDVVNLIPARFSGAAVRDCRHRDAHRQSPARHAHHVA